MTEHEMVTMVRDNIVRSLGLAKKVCDTLLNDLARLDIQQRRQAGYSESSSLSGPEQPRLEQE